MSVVTSLNAVPNRMVIVWRYLLVAGRSGVEESKLSRLLRPSSLPSREAESDEERPGEMVTQVLSELRTLGLIERVEDAKVKLTAAAPDGADGTFLEFVEKRLLYPEIAEQHGQGRVPKALAWFLAQDPAQPLTWGRNYRADVEADCGTDIGAFDLTSVARFQQFLYWARYLGFAWRLEMQGVNAVFPDPTTALARHLPAAAGGKDRRPIQEVADELAHLLPVLEGGAARSDVESRLPLEKQRPGGHLSRSTSFALERLERRGQLLMEQLADAPGVALDRASGPRSVSHITWRDGE